MLNTFLKHVKSELQNLNKYQIIKLVLGNVSCDLDSVVSALIYSYILYQELEMEEILIIPVLNIKKEEFSLRSEVKYFLNENHIQSEYLIFRNEIPMDKLEQKIKLILVDHHVLEKEDRHLWKNVEEIIDHRPQNQKMDYSHIKEIKILPVGSCSTLISQIFISKHIIYNEDIVFLLYGTIIFDTVCLKQEAQRTTDLDKFMIEILENKYLNKKINKEALFKSILRAKTDISSLTSLEIIKKDLKFLNSIPISSVPLLIQDFVKRTDIENILKELLNFLECNLIILIGAKIDDHSIQRDIGFYSNSRKLKEKLLSFLLKEDYQLIFLNTFSNVTVLNQRNIAMTRKAWIPIFTDIFQRMNLC